VLFDFYGTLASATAWGASHDEVLARHGYEPGVALQGWLSDDGLYDGQEHHEHSRSRDHYRAWELDRLRALAGRAGVGPDDLDRLVADLDAAGKEFTLTAYGEAEAALRELRDRDVIVAVCSNWDWDLDRALAATGLADLVDHQVTSPFAGSRPMVRCSSVTR
jgi:putative hydrolase of the HAD superfamily